MTIRGNYHIYFAISVIMGIIIFAVAPKYGVYGLGVVMILIQIPLFLIFNKHKPDEREKALMYKIDSFGMAFTIAIAVIIYLFFSQLNWFFTLISAMYVTKGLIGLLIFSLE